MGMVRIVRFLMKLSSETVQIELKNGALVQGTIVGVDLAMNTHLKALKLLYKNTDVVKADLMTIRGSHIRYVIIPDSVNVESLLAALDTIKDRPKKESRSKIQGRSRGRGRSRERKN